MPPVNTIQTNFTSGEISPLMHGRVDITRYANGAKRLKNMIVKPHGVAMRRMGSRYVQTVKDSAKKTRLVRFVFSTVQAYILEFGHLYIRIYKDGGRVESAGVPVEVTTTYTESELFQLNFTQSADVLYIAHGSHKPTKLSRTSHTAWTLTDYANEDGPYLSINETDNALTLTNWGYSAHMYIYGALPLSGADVGKYAVWRENGIWKLAQVLTVLTGNHATVHVVPDENVLNNIDDTVRTVYSLGTITTPTLVGVFGYKDVGKFYRATADGLWYSISSFTNTSLISASVVALANMAGMTGVKIVDTSITADVTAETATFASTDIDRSIRFNFAGTQIWGKIYTYTSATVVRVSLNREPPIEALNIGSYINGAVTKQWRLGAWSTTTGWPAVVTFHEQRLVWANTTLQPQTMWMTVSGDFENFAPTDDKSAAQADSAITYTIASNEVNAIVWVTSGSVLLAGTIAGEFQIRAASAINEAITPSNISVSPQTRFGSTLEADPFRISSAVLFLQRGGRKVREMTYNFEIDAFVAKDLTIISEHLLREPSTGKYTSHQSEPNNIFWVVTDNGKLVGMTYEHDQEVIAWHCHDLGGDVESIATIPASDGNYDIVYLIVKRTINGTTKRFIEYIEREFFPTGPQDKDGMFYVDAGLTYDGAPATTISGLTHLNGESVDIVADGASLPRQTVVAGAITLSVAASVVHVGLPNEAILEILPLEGGSQIGTAQAKTKRIDQMGVRVMHTPYFKHGVEETDMYEYSARSTGDPSNQSPDLFTGDVKFSPKGSYTLSAGYIFKQDRPYPMNIVAVMPQFKTNE